MGPRFFLLSIFACASGLIVTEVSVLGILALAQPSTYNLGVGAGIFFCGVGALISTLGLRYLAAKFDIRMLTLFAVTGGCAAGLVLWLLSKHIPFWLVGYLSGVIFSSLYVILNYALSVSVYKQDHRDHRDYLAKRMIAPFLLAQGITPFGCGWVFDHFGIGGAAVLLMASYLVPSLYIFLKSTPRPPENMVAGSFRASDQSQGVRNLLIIATISTFVLNWYFSSMLTLFSNQDVSMTTLGAILSCLSFAGMAGAWWIGRRAMPVGRQFELLSLTALVASPGLILFHTVLNPGLSATTAMLLMVIGFGIGVDATLSNSIKYKLLDEAAYLGFHRFLSLLTIGATLLGSLLGVMSTQQFGWVVSMLICLALSAILSVKPYRSISLLPR